MKRLMIALLGVTALRVATVSTPVAVADEDTLVAGALDDAAPDRNDGTLPLDHGERPELNGGTLPLRLPNDGTLPLRLGGTSIQGNNHLETLLLITHASAAALPEPQGSALGCQLAGNTVSAHSAAGSLSIGSDRYNIRGICFDHASNAMEVVADRGGTGQRSFMVGNLASDQPDAFAGNLTITGSAQAGRYAFDLRSGNE